MRLILLGVAILQSACSTLSKEEIAANRAIMNDYANNPDTQYSRISVPDKRGQVEYYFRPLTEFSSTMTMTSSAAAQQCQTYAQFKIANDNWLTSCRAALLETDLSPFNRVATLYNQGLIQMKLGDSEAAKQSFEAAIQHEPDFAAAYFGQAMIASNQSDYERAILLAERAIDMDLDHAHEAYNLIGYVRERQFDFDKARTAYRRALKIRPGASDARLNLERVNRLWPEKPVRNFATQI